MIKYNLSTEFYVERCRQLAEAGNWIRLRSELRYAMYDLGLAE